MGIERKPMDETAKLLMVVLGAGSIGGLGGHTIATDETAVTESTIHGCMEFSKHARAHERLACEQEKTLLLMDCGK